MKRWFFLAISLALLLPHSAWATDARRGPIGVGVMLGEPNGVNLKFMTNAAQGLSLGAGIDMEESGDWHFHADYQHHFFPLDDNDWQEGNLALYTGVGLRLRFLDGRDDDAGLRIPLGASFTLARVPLDLFVEVAPVLVLLPEREMDTDWVVGARFWF